MQPYYAAPDACVPNRTYGDLTRGAGCEHPDTMTKSRATGHARRTPAMHLPAPFPSTVEGRVTELCRDLEVQAKRMRELQAQAEELRLAIGQWAREFEAAGHPESSIRAERR